MPESLFHRALSHAGQGLAAVESVANLCRTSLTATAIRYAEVTEDAAAIIISTGKTIDYCFLSDTMKSLPQITWLRKGAPVPKATITADFNADSTQVASAGRVEDDIDIMDWLGGIRSIEATEETIGLGRYGKTLTVLTCPSLVDETYYDEDEDPDLEESWTPRFR